LGKRARNAAQRFVTGAVTRAQTSVTGFKKAHTGAVICAQPVRMGAIFSAIQEKVLRIILTSVWKNSSITLSQKVREDRKARGNEFQEPVVCAKGLKNRHLFGPAAPMIPEAQTVFCLTRLGRRQNGDFSKAICTRPGVTFIA
jgi:hypothetical protein